MKYWFKQQLYDDSECRDYNDKVKTEKVKRFTRKKAEKIAKILERETNILNLKPFWTTIKTFGWVMCNFEPEKTGPSIIGRGNKNLFELVKDKYNYIILSNNIDLNIEETNVQEKDILIVNIWFFKEFVSAFSNPEKRIRLFLYRFDDPRELDIVKRWMNSRPKSYKEEDSKYVSKDIFELIKENKEIFKSKLNIARFLDLIKSSHILTHYKNLREELDKFKEKIDNPETKEMEINKFLLDKPWIISFDYASLESKKVGKFDIFLSNKNWDVRQDIVIELKKSNKKIKTSYSTHETISSELGKAISQCINYMEEKKNIIDKGVVIIGRGNPESLNKLDKYLHNIELLTYDKIYERAKRTLDFLQKRYLEEDQLEEKNEN